MEFLVIKEITQSTEYIIASYYKDDCLSKIAGRKFKHYNAVKYNNAKILSNSYLAT